MLQFHQVNIDDRDRLLPLLTEKDRGCEYTFSNIYLYRSFYGTQIAYYEDSAVIRFESTDAYLMPVGSADLSELVSELPAGKDGNIRFVCVTAEDTDRLREAFGEMVVSVFHQGDSEYVYRSSDLATLSGKKYHSKRNFCSRFERLSPDYSFELIGPDNISEVAAMNAAWYVERRGSGEDLERDYASSTGSLNEFQQLGLTGALIRTSSGVIAWCCGEKVADGVFCTHVEKALGSMDGAYAVINRDFARYLSADYELINREDDAGEEGLRKAKMSYHPIYTLDKNVVVISK